MKVEEVMEVLKVLVAMEVGGNKGNEEGIFTSAYIHDEGWDGYFCYLAPSPPI